MVIILPVNHLPVHSLLHEMNCFSVTVTSTAAVTPEWIHRFLEQAGPGAFRRGHMLRKEYLASRLENRVNCLESVLGIFHLTKHLQYKVKQH